jgi:hypothetical protein
MADTTDSRINRMGERLAVVENQTKSLEANLPRIRHLELGLAELDTKMSGMQDDLQTIKEDSHHTMGAVDEVITRINRLFWTGAGVMMAVGIVASMIQVGGAWGSFDKLIHDTNTETQQP